MNVVMKSGTSATVVVATTTNRECPICPLGYPPVRLGRFCRGLGRYIVMRRGHPRAPLISSLRCAALFKPTVGRLHCFGEYLDVNRFAEVGKGAEFFRQHIFCV